MSLHERACGCGWTLPLSVMAFPLKEQPEEGKQARGAYVALNCPDCGQGHLFFNQGDPAHVAAAKALLQ